MVNCPCDWKVKKLGDILKVKRGKRVVRRQLSTRGKFPVYQNSLAPLGFFERYNCEARSAFMIAAGNAGDIGFSEIAFWAADDCYYFEECKNIEQKFLYYMLFHHQKYIYTQTRRTSIPRLSHDILENILIPLPTLKEQKAIADTLAVFDTHITNLTELIAKKKAIRDGALEDLMNGRTRLKGFCGEWEVKNFDEMFIILSNNTLSRDKLTTRGKIGNIHYGDVLIKYASILTIKDSIPRIKTEYEASAQKFLRKNDIIIADTAEDETVGKAVQIGDVNIPLVAGLHTIPCRPVIDTAPGYLGYYINCKLYHDQLLPYITGIKVSSISKSSIRKTKIKLPSLEEQIAIADTLTALDTEITALEAEREKISQIRDGAMNDLLTGKVRLLHGNRKTATEPRKTLAD